MGRHAQFDPNAGFVTHDQTPSNYDPETDESEDGKCVVSAFALYAMKLDVLAQWYSSLGMALGQCTTNSMETNVRTRPARSKIPEEPTICYRSSGFPMRQLLVGVPTHVQLGFTRSPALQSISTLPTKSDKAIS
ncbi:hypothetical protein E4U53_006278 [Claviceps sorghi]|nr:hypothetical protein E4U53_006278 [Claviceps sorghi]